LCLTYGDTLPCPKRQYILRYDTDRDYKEITYGDTLPCPKRQYILRYDTDRDYKEKYITVLRDFTITCCTYKNHNYH